MITNLRDLGGIPAKDGRRVKSCKYLRSATLKNADAEDIKLLTEGMHLTRILDLRTMKEITQTPSPEMPGVENVAHPLVEYTNVGISKTSSVSLEDKILAAGSKEERLAVIPSMTEIYPGMIYQPFSLNAMREFIHMLIGYKGGATLFHCISGKDRTGMAAATLLELLGVERALIMEDYMKSLPSASQEAEKLYAKVFGKCGDADIANKVCLLNLVDESYLESYWKAIENRFGSFDAFAAEGLALSAQDIEVLRSESLE